VAVNDSAGPDFDLLRETERRRLAALVARDMDTAEALHAEDYQFINPAARILGKERYLANVGAGRLVYDSFEPVSDMAARGGADMVLLRYRARFSIGGGAIAMTCWTTTSYERHEGHWQAVWSQGTRIPDEE
jgi:Domain of unknown function (DUF4440)